MTKGENAECHRVVNPAVRCFVITGIIEIRWALHARLYTPSTVEVNDEETLVAVCTS